MIIIDKMPQFKRSVNNVFNDALREGARDALINAKDKAPYAKGGLRGESEIKKNNNLSWRISFWIEYARFQEFGGTAKRRVRNYSTSGTGAHFLRNAGDEQAERISSVFRKHALRARP